MGVHTGQSPHDEHRLSRTGRTRDSQSVHTYEGNRERETNKPELYNGSRWLMLAAPVSEGALR